MSSSEAPPPGVGDLVADRYRIESVIGTGGMAVVYRALDEELGRLVALKVFRESVVDAATLSRQAEEIRLIASLDHPALVTLYDAAPGGVLVMQLVEGHDLRHRIAEDGPVGPQAVAAIGADIAGALAYVHGRGVIHRDISPANVLLPSDHRDGAPVARLADFGIARLIDSAGLTQAGTVIGTASYLSPEQAEGRQLTAATDIYSLGLTLLEALTGERAFPGVAIESATARLANDPPIPTSLAAGWVTLLTSMTARDPQERPTAVGLAAVLRDLDTGSTAEIATALMPATVTGPTKLMPVAADQATELLPAAAGAVVAGAAVSGAAPIDATEVLHQGTVVDTPQTPRRPVPADRRRALLIVGALGAAALIVAIVIALSGIGGPPTEPPADAAASPTAEAEPVVQEPVAPAYPAVEGELGTSLAALQATVGFDRLDEAVATALQQQVLAISTNAAAADYETAQQQVEQLKRAIEEAENSGTINGAAADDIRDALDAVKDDLSDLIDDGDPGKGPKDKKP